MKESHQQGKGYYPYLLKMPKNGSTSFKDTVFGILSREKLVKLEEKGIKKGAEYLYFTFSKNPKLNIDIDLILKLHKESFAWIFPKWAGKFRTINVTYSGKEAIDYYKVREAITNLCLDLKVRIKHLPSKKDYKYIDEVIKLLAWFQHKFVQIHPFNDYNGRMARMLTTLLLVKFNLHPIEIKAETKKDRIIYIKALQSADEGDYSQLEKLIETGLIESLSVKV